MSDETRFTLQDCVAGAFQALLRGDTAERDRLCAIAEGAFAGEEELPGNTDVLRNIKNIN